MSRPGQNVRVALPMTEENLLLESQETPLATSTPTSRPGPELGVTLPQTNKILNEDLERQTTERTSVEMNSEEPSITTIDEKLDKAFQKLFAKYNWSANLTKETAETIEEPDDINDNNDNIESAKEWAKRQKQSLMKN